jgi:membrane protein involved in colicin uptake
LRAAGVATPTLFKEDLVAKYFVLAQFDAGEVKGKKGQVVDCSEEQAKPLLEKKLVKAYDAKSEAEAKAKAEADAKADAESAERAQAKKDADAKAAKAKQPK